MESKLDKYGLEYLNHLTQEIQEELQSANTDVRYVKYCLRQIWFLTKMVHKLQQNEALLKDAAHKAVLDRKQANR